MTDTTLPAAPLGWAGVLTGTLALMLTIIAVWAGPLAPQQALGVSLGDIPGG
jgi:hypothetical protein